jgi:hypothetical protein
MLLEGGPLNVMLQRAKRQVQVRGRDPGCSTPPPPPPPLASPPPAAAAAARSLLPRLRCPQATFLPAGYPGSVGSNYMQYTLWQAATK